jgi:methyl-accepting chemotaxis protein
LKRRSIVCVHAALAGDFSRRLSVLDKQGFFRQLAEGLNRLSETTHSGLTEVAQMFKSLSEGDLSGRIDTDYHGIFGELQDDAKGSVARLREILVRLQSASDAINTAAQANSLQQTSSATEMLSYTVRKNAEGAQRADGATIDEVVSRFRQVASLVAGISDASLAQPASIEHVSKAVSHMKARSTTPPW